MAELDFSKVDNKTKLETMLQEERAIREENREREMERLADAAEKAARVSALSHRPVTHSMQALYSLYLLNRSLLLTTK